LRKSTYKVKFVEKVEEIIVATNLKEMIDEFCVSIASTDQLEQLDKQITFVLDVARRYTEGLKRTIPFLIAKVELRAKYLYWMA